MKNESLQQLFKRTVGENLLKVIFVKPEEASENTNEATTVFNYNKIPTQERLLKEQKVFGIKVQSVALPTNYEIFKEKSETEVLDWLQNKIQNVHTAFFDFNNKYNDNAEQVSWYNNKMLNQRFLETSGR